MDKRAKRRIEVLRTKLQKAEQLLSAAKRQRDDEAEVTRLEKEVATIKEEIARAKGDG